MLVRILASCGACTLCGNAGKCMSHMIFSDQWCCHTFCSGGRIFVKWRVYRFYHTLKCSDNSLMNICFSSELYGNWNTVLHVSEMVSWTILWFSCFLLSVVSFVLRVLSSPAFVCVCVSPLVKSCWPASVSPTITFAFYVFQKLRRIKYSEQLISTIGCNISLSLEEL